MLDKSWHQEILKPGFAVSMFYVKFAYTGWNAAAYVVDEIKNPAKNLPLALIGSTLFVSVIDVLFQLVFLRNATVAQMEGKEEVAFIAFDNLLGSSSGNGLVYLLAFN